MLRGRPGRGKALTWAVTRTASAQSRELGPSPARAPGFRSKPTSILALHTASGLYQQRPLSPHKRPYSRHPGLAASCQTRKSPGSFNHLVGEQLKGVGHGEAEGRGGLEINDEFVFERELNWQIARICASQNLVHV